MNRLNYFFVSFFACLCTFSSYAQDKAGGITRSEDRTDFMLSEGKIYVVVAVIVIILCGLFLYLYNLDKKIAALEKKKP